MGSLSLSVNLDKKPYAFFSVCRFFSTLILNACIHVPNWGIYFCGGGVHYLLKTLNGVFVWTDEWSEQRGYAEVRPKKHSRSTMWVPNLEAAGWDLRPLLAWSSLAHCLSFIATTHKCNHCKLWKKKNSTKMKLKSNYTSMKSKLLTFWEFFSIYSLNILDFISFWESELCFSRFWLIWLRTNLYLKLRFSKVITKDYAYIFKNSY